MEAEISEPRCNFHPGRSGDCCKLLSATLVLNTTETVTQARELEDEVKLRGKSCPLDGGVSGIPHSISEKQAVF